MAADRYLAVVRYLDTLNEDERRSMLHDSATTIQALLTTIHLKARGGLWTDPLERPTAAGLLNVLVPVTDIKVRSSGRSFVLWVFELCAGLAQR